jgi:D-alanyl-D-alanine endopeptidase (penicillin-binding protein 7)
VNNNSVSPSAGSSSASISWSANDVSQFLEDDETEISPQGSTSVTTILRGSGSASITSSTAPQKSVQIRDTFGYSNQPSVNARAALVMDAQTGEVLYSKNSSLAVPIASITKVMTAVVTADARLDMSEEITLQQIDFAGAGGKNSSSTLRAGDTMNRAELLLFALMKSENPAAAALARTYPGGRSAFVAAMNAKARQLGMTSTRYAESTGLDPHNVSSARDLGILVSAASQYGLIRQFSTTPTYDFNLGYRVLKSNNTNALVRNGGWNINLSKTGYINEAGRCVVMHTTVNSRPAVVVLLGASTSQARTNDATNLLNWVATLPKRI